MPHTHPDQPPEATTLYDGKYIRLVREGTWEFVRRKNVSGIVGVVAVTDDRRLVLVEQYRRPVGKRVIELPAGLAGDTKGSEHEPLADAARRELLEETGYAAADMTRVCAGPSSAGLGDEVITLFRATGLRKAGPGDGDGDEDITLHEVPLDGIEGWLDARAGEGKLIDLKVYAGLYFVRG
ncbi:MAG: ADP-ribose pyrophosphatase [Phycisphaerales bacterium]|nr:ADP-ribose pyrophosphatase [Phycisphaerales bacterium]